MSNLTCEDATLAATVFQLISDGRLQAARTAIDEALAAREPVNYDSVVSMYNTLLPMLPPVRQLNPSRKTAIRQRHHEHRKEVDFWQNYFIRVSRSLTLTGRKPGFDWKPNFDWLVKPANMIKVLEGNYDPVGSAPRAKFDASDEAAFRMSGVG